MVSSMFCGLDFGTSNSSIAHHNGIEPTLIPLEGEELFLPSVIYAQKYDVKAQKIDEKEVLKLTDSLFRSRENSGERKKTRKEIEKMVRNRLRRDAAAKASQEYKNLGISSLTSESDMLFGREAIKSNALYPDDGIYSKSSKTFLGADIQSGILYGFEIIVQRILQHIKQNAEKHLDSNISDIVLGRPVNYGVASSEAGNKQAVNIMLRAAKNVGFKNIEFEYEPVAAAFHFERTLVKKSNVLIVDIGGGTTDVTMMQLSREYSELTDRKNHILAASGRRIGGNDLDIRLSYLRLCRYLGKEYLGKNNVIFNKDSPVSNHAYIAATHINDIRSLNSFPRHKEEIYKGYESSNGEMKRMVGRLKLLLDKGYVFRFNHSAELAKKLLSEKSEIKLPLKYLDHDLVISLTHQDLRDVISTKAGHIREIIYDVISSSGVKPDYIYFTGGSAKSPILLDLLLKDEDKSKVVSGDQFGSVTKGLSIAAYNRFS